MAKKKLTALAEEYNQPLEKMRDIVSMYLDEEMVTGRGKNTWIDERGQAIIDDCVPMPAQQEGPEVYRGQVLNECPNPMFLWVHHRDRACKVAVKIPKRMQGKLLDKIIYFEEIHDGDKVNYNWVKK